MTIIFRGVNLTFATNTPPGDIGFIDDSSQSPPPPGPPLPPPPPLVGATIFSFHDTFSSPISGTNNGRSPDTSSPAGLVWQIAPGGIDAGNVLDGELLMVTNVSNCRIVVPGPYKFDQPGGMFIEFTATIDDPDNCGLLMGFNLGTTSLSLTLFGNAGGAPEYLKRTIKMDVGGLNGYPAPDNFTTDSYYSAPGDYRGKAIRLELASNLVTLKVDGVPIIQQVPRFTVITQATSDTLISLFPTYLNGRTYRITDMSAGALSPH